MGKRTIIVRALGENGEVIEEVEHAVPQGKHLRVRGDEVQAGEHWPTARSTSTTSCIRKRPPGVPPREIQNVYRSSR